MVAKVRGGDMGLPAALAAAAAAAPRVSGANAPGC